MIPFYTDLLDRFQELHSDIEKIVDSLPAEALDWSPGPDINSLSVLVVHLTGAERFLIGDIVMGASSNRNRDAEFQVSGLDKADLLRRLNDTEVFLKTVLEALKLSDLENMRTHPRHGRQVSVAFALLHALEHAATHHGHIQLTAQLWQQSHSQA
ncbi:MAG: DinB family protein [Acidobacteriaceae bacterium]